MAKFIVSSIPNVPHKDERIFAFFYSGDYGTIMGETMKKQREVTRYICIANKDRKIYKQYFSLPGVSKEHIAIDYESTCNLDVNNGDSVNVYSISKLRYYWHTCDSIAKLSLILAFLSLVLSVVLGITL